MDPQATTGPENFTALLENAAFYFGLAVTLFVVLLAALAFLLFRYGHPDLLRLSGALSSGTPPAPPAAPPARRPTVRDGEAPRIYGLRPRRRQPDRRDVRRY